MIVLVVVGVLVLLGAAVAVLYPTLRDQTMAEAAIGTWSCHSLTDPATAVDRTAVIGDGTFTTDAGYVGTWRVDDGRVAIDLTSAPRTLDHMSVAVFGLPQDASPAGAFTLDNGGSAIRRMSWSYADGRVTFSEPRGLNGGSRPVAECRRVG